MSERELLVYCPTCGRSYLRSKRADMRVRCPKCKRGYFVFLENGCLLEMQPVPENDAETGERLEALGRRIAEYGKKLQRT